jgi:hypothetical protein
MLLVLLVLILVPQNIPRLLCGAELRGLLEGESN